MKSITWITSGYLLQVDLPLLSELKERYKIHWVIMSNNPDQIRTASEYAKKHNIEIELFSTRGHRYLPLCLLDYYPLFKKLADRHDDIYYLDCIAFPYMIFAIKRYLPSEKVIMAMHHGKIHNGMQLRHLYKYYLRYLCNQPFRFQYFSNTQADYFTGSDHSRKEVIPLALNDYGMSVHKPQQDYIQFLSFGHIIETKNIELLIEAACRLKELSDVSFKVKIVGHCRLWKVKYQPLIKYPEIFDLDIQMVPDEMIPELFSTSHYLVLPYKAVTQSGPLRIAYGYNTPVITSDLDGFKESVIEGTTGYMFNTENVDSLVQVMKSCVDGGVPAYEHIKNLQAEYVKENLDVKSVVNKYIQMFDKI